MKYILSKAKLKELADGKKILEALSMQLMDVDALVKTKYTSILAASDEEKRMKEQKEVVKLSPEFHINLI